MLINAHGHTALYPVSEINSLGGKTCILYTIPGGKVLWLLYVVVSMVLGMVCLFLVWLWMCLTKPPGHNQKQRF